MSDVTARHQQTVVSDLRQCSRFRPAMNGNALANHAPVTDPRSADRARLIRLILWQVAERGPRVDPAAAPQGGERKHGDVRSQNCSCADFDCIVDDTEWPDDNPRSQPGVA
jgi:hypothetical protein